jgi:hypothetical protein
MIALPLRKKDRHTAVVLYGAGRLNGLSHNFLVDYICRQLSAYPAEVREVLRGWSKVFPKQPPVGVGPWMSWGAGR